MVKKNQNRQLYIVGALFIVLAFGIVIAKTQGWIGQDKSIDVTVAPAQYTEIIEKVSASGKIQPETEVRISPDVPGEITDLYVEEGDSVIKGQLLLRIRADNYQSVVEMQQAQVSSQRANLAQARAQLAQTHANSQQTQLTYRRNTELFNQKVISPADYEASKAAYEVSLQEIEASRQRLRAAEYNLQNALASLGESQKNLRKTTLYAPVNGTISKLSVEKGERVVGTSQMAGTELLRIANLNTMEVRVNVNENDIIRINVGDSAIVEVDSYSGKDEKFKGIVTQIANTANDAVSLEAVTEFEVRIRLLNDSFKHLVKQKGSITPFRPGMTASVDIITDRKNKTLSVPLSAVTTRSTTTATKTNQNKAIGANNAAPGKKEEVEEIVFVHQKGKVLARKVKTGISDFDNIEILNGLKEGEEVISGPFRAVSQQLKDGDSIIIKDEAALAQSENKEENK
ncbi:efflux RND transporter periplasmic adaptor subunit [Adhaeribacter aquaticus]|uniref:efflux RND transporter periplasmic adaptor subunit n=1 Tax=Adhaeribacter aquaticus TaxID=299567 RepID=UPI0003FEAFCE|nr:efflux RND transporter periplasmic adaptor subunit [Adhaeribacter aquaticus]